MVIRTPDQRLRVFVSSTLGELAAERQAVARAVAALRLTPVMFEAGARPHPPQALYRAYLAQSDVFVGLYWQRYGQLNPGMQVSGLEEELQLSQGLPRLLYVKTPAPDREPRLTELLARIRDQASYRRFRTPGELGRLVRDDLAALLSERFAARPRLLDPQALLGRLATSLDALGTGAVDLRERQRTLRATVEWSVGLLDQAERSLLEVVAVFVDGWTIDAAAQVAGLEEDRALDLSEALIRHSLLQLERTALEPRVRMLETVRAFVAERLAARPDLADVERRHADYYRGLAEQADGPLRGVGQNEWAERLEAEAGNLAAAVGWCLAHDPTPLPHLFRILWPFWELRDHMGEAHAWVEQLLPSADSLDPQARAELLWTAAVTATEVGDDAAVLLAHERLGPLLEGIQDPFLHAVSQLAMAWSWPIVGDFDGALRAASVSLEELRGQDEPFWTATAVLTAGSVETAVGRYDDALRHLTEMRDLAERLDNAWLAASSRVELGNLAVVRGRLEEARALLDEGLGLSLAAHSTPLVTLCLAAFARLALAEGDPERAALVAGAADGLRRRVGLRAWPSRRGGRLSW